MTTITGHTTRASGTILTATIYNADHVVHVTNAQNLNSDKAEGPAGPVVDGHAVLFNGTAGNLFKTAGFAPASAAATLQVANDLSDVADAEEAFDNIKQAGTTTSAGVFEKATDAEARASAADKAITADLVESASAIVTLTDAATIAVDWDTFINGTVTLTANRTLGNPTNGQPGTWRTIEFVQDGGGTNTLSFGNQYVFPEATAPILTTAGGARDRLFIFCATATRFEVYAGGLGLAAP